MFNILNEYKLNGKFILEIKYKLIKVSKDVVNEPGVYLIYKNSLNVKNLLYIGKAGTFNNIRNDFKGQKLRTRIVNTRWNLSGEKSLIRKMKEQNISKLIFRWYVTVDTNVKHIPLYTESFLLQEYFEKFRKLPSWNKCF
ncbi:MAG: hypothetical protein IT280_00245 [Ignavibacteria bacterium]|nr:hypothetical protein [Ignavibacteria bacterium]